MKNQYAGKNAEQVWNEWTEEQREHFLRDHQLSQYYDDDDLVFYLSANLDEIPREIGDTLKRHISEGQYKKGGTPGEYEYYIYEDGNWRKATKADFKYWYDKFASEVMDRFGKTHKKGEIPFSEVENIYNPQGYMVAEKISKMAKGGQYKKGGSIPNNYKGKTPEQVWGAWNLEQKRHFLSDHTNLFAESSDPYFIENTARKKFDALPNKVHEELFRHISVQGQYKKGGTPGKKYGVYVYGKLQDSYSDELIADAAKHSLQAIHPTWKIEVKPLKKSEYKHGGLIDFSFLTQKVSFIELFTK